ncbi:MAG TPA: hypothetical protein DDX57_01110 [Bacteroidales bacterium]|nr:hypothetical protein [Bacteroidales bacterium]HCB60422.1 hypothetical protein [Bacteroidales bacterium]
MRLSQNDFSGKNNIPPSGSDNGAGGHGTVVFASCSDGSMFRLNCPEYYQISSRSGGMSDTTFYLSQPLAIISFYSSGFHVHF